MSQEQTKDEAALSTPQGADRRTGTDSVAKKLVKQMDKALHQKKSSTDTNPADFDLPANKGSVNIPVKGRNTPPIGNK